jgi:hypothetical protein
LECVRLAGRLRRCGSAASPSGRGPVSPCLAPLAPAESSTKLPHPKGSASSEADRVPCLPVCLVRLNHSRGAPSEALRLPVRRFITSYLALEISPACWALGVAVSASRLHVNSGTWTHFPSKGPPRGQAPIFWAPRSLSRWTQRVPSDPDFFPGAYKRAYKRTQHRAQGRPPSSHLSSSSFQGSSANCDSGLA